MYILLLADAEVAELDDISETICNQNSPTDFCTEMGCIWLHKSVLVVYGDVSIQIERWTIYHFLEYRQDRKQCWYNSCSH